MYQKTNKSTVYNELTPHGMNTPHQHPSASNNVQVLLNLVNQLYPTGRAFYLTEQKNLTKIHDALNVMFLSLINDATGTIDSVIPDNQSCSEEDCTFLEYQYGLLTNEDLSLIVRRNNILRKMAFPNNIKERQSRSYIQKILNDYGFNVGVYENIFDDGNGNLIHKIPNDVFATNITPTEHGGNTQHGAVQHGLGNYDVIANSMYEEVYAFGGVENLYATFFISGFNDITIPAQIEEIRKSEFKELVLKLKPAHTVAFLFINWI